MPLTRSQQKQLQEKPIKPVVTKSVPMPTPLTGDELTRRLNLITVCRITNYAEQAEKAETNKDLINILYELYTLINKNLLPCIKFDGMDRLIQLVCEIFQKSFEYENKLINLNEIDKQNVKCVLINCMRELNVAQKWIALEIEKYEVTPQTICEDLVKNCKDFIKNNRLGKNNQPSRSSQRRVLKCNYSDMC